MDTLSNLALKGHFEELKKKFDRKGMAKAGGGAASKDMLNIVSKAVSMAEDMYEHDPSFFTEDHREDYRMMVQLLHENGSIYKGHPDLMEIEQKPEIPASYSKKPMQKAGVTTKEEFKNKKTG